MLVSLLKALLLFALLGPPFGLVGLLVQNPSTVVAASTSDLLLIPLSYVFGLVPALSTGLVAWSLRRRLGRWSGAFLCGMVGAFVAALFWLVLPHSQLQGAQVLQLGILPGGFAGLVCGLIYYWPPNNSFKPKPLRGSA
jgi:hypothetical protein